MTEPVYVNFRALRRMIRDRRFIPDETLDNAVTLEIDKMGIHELDESIYDLLQLELLNVRCNRISMISDKICKLVFLVRLHLGDNCLSEIPDSLFHLAHLQNLNLRNNQLTHISDNIGKLGNLECLYLCGNQLTVLPDGICDLHFLRILMCGHNKINRIPNNMHHLVRLDILNMDNNPLKHIPFHLRSWLKSGHIRYSGLHILLNRWTLDTTWARLLRQHGVCHDVVCIIYQYTTGCTGFIDYDTLYINCTDDTEQRNMVYSYHNRKKVRTTEAESDI